MEDPPYLHEEQERRKDVSVDYMGLALVALGIGCLQMVLDKGQELGLVRLALDHGGVWPPRSCCWSRG